MGQACCLLASSGEEEERTDVPYDVLQSILARLPVKSLVRFRCVSKQWNETIANNRNFAVEHRLIQQQQKAICHNVIYRGPSFWPRVVGKLPMLSIMPQVKLTLLECPFAKGRKWFSCASCHGLLCVVLCADIYNPFEKISIVIWNIATRQYREVAYPSLTFTSTILQYDAGLLGFGYDPTTSDYKILILDSGVFKEPTSSFLRILSLKTNTWSLKGVINDAHFGPRMPQPVSMDNGDIYWIGFMSHQSNFRFELFKFSLVEERLTSSIPLPAPASHLYDKESNWDCYCRLGQHSGCSLNLYFRNKNEIHMWKKDDGYSNSTTWSLVAAFNYDLMDIPRNSVIGFLGDDGAIISISQDNLFVYKPAENRYINFNYSPSSNFYQMQLHLWSAHSAHFMLPVETLILP